MKLKKFLLAYTILSFLCTAAFAQKQEPLLSPRAFVKTKHLTVSYGQPSKRNRVIFGELVPYGEVWRTGANEATEITFKKNASFGGKQVAAGTYTLFTIPNEKEWTVILNSQLKQWGAYEYEKHKDKDVVQITVPVEVTDTAQEKLSYEMKKNNLVIKWDKMKVAIPVTF